MHRAETAEATIQVGVHLDDRRPFERRGESDSSGIARRKRRPLASVAGMVAVVHPFKEPPSPRR